MENRTIWTSLMINGLLLGIAGTLLGTNLVNDSISSYVSYGLTLIGSVLFVIGVSRNLFVRFSTSNR